MGTYPEGVQDLEAIEADLIAKSPKSTLVPYATYRLMQSRVLRSICKRAKNNKEKQADIQEAWLQNARKILSKNIPRPDDCRRRDGRCSAIHEELARAHQRKPPRGTSD